MVVAVGILARQERWPMRGHVPVEYGIAAGGAESVAVPLTVEVWSGPPVGPDVWGSGSPPPAPPPKPLDAPPAIAPEIIEDVLAMIRAERDVPVPAAFGAAAAPIRCF